MDSEAASCSMGGFLFHVLILCLVGLTGTPVGSHEDTKDEPEHVEGRQAGSYDADTP